jgi:hypothetical protein
MEEIHFKTRELNFFEKFLQMYWMNPDSWLLDEFKLTGDSLTIIRKDGHVFHSRLHDTQSSYLMDKYDRREVKISNKEGGKTRFKEIPGMLSEEEWDLILIKQNSTLWKKIQNPGIKNGGSG